MPAVKWPVSTAAALLGWSCLTAPCLHAEELRLDAKALLARGVSAGLVLSDDGASIELQSGVLHHDDGEMAGYSYRPNEEPLKDGVQIKKELRGINPRARAATLLVAPGGQLQSIVNGQPTALRRQGKAGQYWEQYDVPITALREGANELVLFGAGKLWIARDDDMRSEAHLQGLPIRGISARSGDGGKAWVEGRLGPNGDIAGQYYVRLFLDQFQPRGSLVLDLIDVGNLAHAPLAPPLDDAGPVTISIAGKTAAECSIVTHFRRGTTHVVDDQHWTDWRLLPADGALPEVRGRFVQVRLELATNDPRQTPRLAGVTIRAEPKPSATWHKGLRVDQLDNAAIVRTSIPFTYEPYDHPRLRQLRQQFRLDEVVADAKGEWELICRLAAWASQRWDRGHLKEIYPPWDALEILKPYDDGEPVGGFCQQYNVVFLQACESFGIPGRAVSIGPGDAFGDRIRGGHEVVEIWSNEHRQWVYIDGNAAWYMIDSKSRAPLSLHQLRTRQLQTFRGEPTKGVEIVTLAPSRYTWKGLEAWPPFVELRMIPRSNFLSQPGPLPLNQGMRGWFWTGHHVWTDGQSPAARLYQHRESVESNWNWTLNQAQVRLEAATEPGRLLVRLDTETPSFDTFRASIDEAPWSNVERQFDWKLHPGENRLRVRPRNRAGREGIESLVVLNRGD